MTLSIIRSIVLLFLVFQSIHCEFLVMTVVVNSSVIIDTDVFQNFFFFSLIISHNSSLTKLYLINCFYVR